MIQRIQSIWFFLAAITLVIMLFMPIISKDIAGTSSVIYTGGLFQEVNGASVKLQSFLPLLMANIALALICFINIFNFKKRSFQKKYGIVTIALIVLFAFWCGGHAEKLPGGMAGAGFGAGAYLPAVAIFFIVLGIFGINKDERLIRSAERLR